MRFPWKVAAPWQLGAAVIAAGLLLAAVLSAVLPGLLMPQARGAAPRGRIAEATVLTSESCVDPAAHDTVSVAVPGGARLARINGCGHTV
ncbi:MAG: hypothetical protein ACRDRL_26680, partial [Sciscionella sp.]